MDVLETWQVDGWPDLVASLFAAAPAGFLLGAFLGVLGFGVFGAVRMLRRLVHG